MSNAYVTKQKEYFNFYFLIFNEKLRIQVLFFLGLEYNYNTIPLIPQIKY